MRLYDTTEMTMGTLSSSQPMKTHSPDVRLTTHPSRMERPTLERKMQEISTNKPIRHPELDGLRRENSQLKSRLRDLVRVQQPMVEHQEIVKLRDRIIEQERIIAGYRLEQGTQSSDYVLNDLRRIAKDRERTIEELKKIIQNISANSICSDLTRTNSNTELKDRIKVLNIENDKLGQMVQRLSGQRSRSDDLHPDIVELKTENEKLKLQITLLKVEQPELKSLQHRLQVQSREISCLEEKSRLQEEQNSTLLRLLKEQSSNSEKRRLEEQVNRLNNVIKLQQDSTEALAKAKQHYAETLVQFKQTVNEEVGRELKRYQQKFLTMKRKLEGIQRSNIAHTGKQEQFDSPIVSRFNPAETNKKLLTLTSFEDTRGATRQMKSDKQLLHNNKQTTQPRKHQGFNATTEQPKLSEEVARLEAVVQALERELASKNDLCSHQQQMFDQLSHELEEYRERSLQAINSQYQTDRASREREIEQLRRLHRGELDSLRTDLQNELINVVNSNTEKVDALRDKIHQQNLDLLRLQGENERLKSQLRLARTNPIVADVVMETRGLLERTSPKSGLTLQRVTEVVSQTDSQPQSKFASVACQTYADTFYYSERSDLKVSVDKFKQVMDNLIIQNGMIPELKNRIQVLEGELLRLEECVEEVHHRQQLIQF